MNLDIHAASIAGLKKQVSVLGVSCAALSIGLLIAVTALTGRHDRIVVVPPGLSGPVAIDWGKADAEYIKTFGIFYSTLLGTINPRNAEYVADRLSAMTAPEAYAGIRKSILSVAKDPSFAGSGSTTNFISNQVVFEPEAGKVFVAGENRTYSGFGQPKNVSVVYEMDVQIVEGRPVIFSVSNYPGTEAHTAEWKTAHPGWNKPEVQK